MQWHKSTHSEGNGGNCVEVAIDLPSATPVRDSKDPDGPRLHFTRPAWSAFLHHLRSNQRAC